MIDLHSHVLPGLDDGPVGEEGALALARLAAQLGTETIVATPHIRDDHPFPIAQIDERARALRSALSEAQIDLEIETGEEVAISKASELTTEALAGLCLGSGNYVLVESPYTFAPQLLEKVLFDLQSRGFRPILAHPERSPSFLSDLPRLERIVEHGVLCSVTALSMAGGFGETVRQFTVRLFSEGLVHDVASDAHDGQRRPPDLLEGFASLDQELPGLAEQAPFFTREAPLAVLLGQELPLPPDPPEPAARGLRRLLGRS